jgi:hypothetical protein
MAVFLEASYCVANGVRHTYSHALGLRRKSTVSAPNSDSAGQFNAHKFKFLRNAILPAQVIKGFCFLKLLLQLSDAASV